MSGEDEQLRESLRGYAARIAETHAMPAASVVWLRAERRRRRLARERAERPLRVMQALGVLCAAAAAGWMLWRSAVVPALETGTAALAIATMVVVAAGCWTMMAASRRSSLF